MRNRFRMALVTGASSGIGACFAGALPRATGLLLSGRDEARLKAVADRQAEEGRAVEAMAANLSDRAGRERLIEKAEALGVDLLINNAGYGAFGRFVENDLETELDMVTVNVAAVVHLTRSLLPGMVARAKRDGARAGVVTVSSIAAFAPLPMFATYAATKTFELSFSEALAEEMKREPVDILAVCPGATRTDFFNRAKMPGGMMPGYEEPEAVARKGLGALGRRRVLVSRAGVRLALTPVTLPRRAAVGGIGHFMRGLAERGNR